MEVTQRAMPIHQETTHGRAVSRNQRGALRVYTACDAHHNGVRLSAR